MEENVLMWIQNENTDYFDYMFYGSQLLEEMDVKKIEIIRNIIFNNPNTKEIWKGKKFSQSSVLKIKKNYLITSVLKSKDVNERHLPFMFYIPIEKNNFEEIIIDNLKMIQKEIDHSLLEKLITKVKINQKKKTIYIGLIIITLIVIYKILK